MFRKILISIPMCCMFVFVIWTLENYAYHGSNMQYYVIDLKTMFENLNSTFTDTMFSSLQTLLGLLQKFNDYVNLDSTLQELKHLVSTDVSALTIVIYCWYIFVLLGKGFLVLVGYIGIVCVGFNAFIIACIQYVLLLFKFLVAPSWCYMGAIKNPYSFNPSSWVWSESSPLVPDSYWGSI